jgi:hypothetical protein
VDRFEEGVGRALLEVCAPAPPDEESLEVGGREGWREGGRERCGQDSSIKSARVPETFSFPPSHARPP